MTIANLRIVPKNDHDEAALTVITGTEVSGFEIANTQNTRRGSYLRSAAATTFEFVGVLPATRTLSHFSMWQHLNHAGNWRLRLYTDTGASAAASPFADSTAVSALSYAAASAYTFSDGDNDPFESRAPSWLWFAETAARSYRVTFTGTPAQAYWQASRFFLGRYYEFAYPVEWGMLRGFGDLSDAVRSQAGSLVTNLGESWPTLEFETKWIPPTHRAALLNIFEYCLTARDVVISARVGEGTDDEAKHCINGRFSAINTIGRTSVNRDSTRFQIVGN